MKIAPACLALFVVVGCGLLSDRPAQSAPPGFATQPRAARNLPAGAQVAEVVIYLPRLLDDASLTLQRVTRTVVTSGDPSRDALETLIRGPNGQERAEGLYPALDPHTQVLGLTVEAGTASVELDEGLRRVHGRPFSELVYWSMVYTLTEAPGVRGVRLVRGGGPLASMGDPAFELPAEGTRDSAPSWARPWQ
ncbi:MAG: putative Lipoprotein LpqB, GerMN domain protein [Chloroflexi bacterium]|nr:putative Lipoprotein LpqB, GerMN domain protein [Chloroflexota bacterium]